jgi:hypothetical protein
MVTISLLSSYICPTSFMASGMESTMIDSKCLKGSLVGEERGKRLLLVLYFLDFLWCIYSKRLLLYYRHTTGFPLMCLVEKSRSSYQTH